MEQESEILRKNLLSLKEQSFPNHELSFSTAYKHYILFFLKYKTQHGEDCLVFDTEKGDNFLLSTGLNMSERVGYSFLYWKDNIFVLYGGSLRKQAEHVERASRDQEWTRDEEVKFLHIIENDDKISFTVEACNIAGTKLWDQCHAAYIHQDNMYVFGNGSLSLHHPPQQFELVKKLDLNGRKWSFCDTTGDIPKPCQEPTTVLLNGKIYFFGSFKEEGKEQEEVLIGEQARRGGGLFGKQATGGGGSLFGKQSTGLFGGQGRGGGLFGTGHSEPEHAHGVFVLDLKNMNWQRTHDKTLLPEDKRFHAEVVGEKIYLSHQFLDEFLIYDPADPGKLLKSKGFSKKENWRIRSFKNHSFIFRVDDQSGGKTDIQYQDLVVSQQQGKIAVSVDPLAATTQQLPYMEYLWKEKPFADITFVVHNEEISAHRAILLKSRYFQKMFKSGMMEANSSKINVPNISAPNFKAILEYIYCDKITLTEPLAMELITLADMYFLPNLKADCEKCLSEKLTPTNFVQIMKVAQTADSEKLEKKVVSFLTSNIEKVKQEVDIHIIPPELFIRAIMDLKSTKK